MPKSEGIAECPLCMEPYEADDINFFPCSCEYQICRFCWHRIRMDENGKCPACRKQYSENPAQFKPMSDNDPRSDHARLQRIKKDRRCKDVQRKQKTLENRQHLANVRVVQKNLVFVVGLSQKTADIDFIRKNEMFLRFGRVLKVVINPSTSYAGIQGPSASAYVTYSRPEIALRTIQFLTNKQLDGRTLKASLGTTKYCSHFLKNSVCTKQNLYKDCMYLHELGDTQASFTKEDMQNGKHHDYEQSLYDLYYQPVIGKTAPSKEGPEKIIPVETKLKKTPKPISHRTHSLVDIMSEQRGVVGGGGGGGASAVGSGGPHNNKQNQINTNGHNCPPVTILQKQLPPNLQQPPPNLPQPTPNLQQPPPNLPQPTPNVQQPPPNLQQPPPNLPQPPPNLNQHVSPPVQIQKPPPNLTKSLPLQLRGSGDFSLNKKNAPNSPALESPPSFSPSPLSTNDESDSTDDMIPPLESIRIHHDDSSSKQYSTDDYDDGKINTESITSSSTQPSESEEEEEEIELNDESADDVELAMDEDIEDNDLTLAPESPTLPKLVPVDQNSSSASSSVPSSFSDRSSSSQPLPTLDNRPTHGFHNTSRLKAANNQVTNPRPFIEPVAMYDVDISELLGPTVKRSGSEYSSLSYFTQALNSTLSKTSTGSTDNQNSSSEGSYSSTSPTDDHPQKQVGVTDWSAAFGFKDDSPQMSNPWSLSCNDRVGSDSYTNGQLSSIPSHSTHAQQVNQQAHLHQQQQQQHQQQQQKPPSQQQQPPPPQSQPLDYSLQPQSAPPPQAHPVQQMAQNGHPANSAYFNSNSGENFPHAPPGLASQFRTQPSAVNQVHSTMRNTSQSVLHNAPPRSLINGHYEPPRQHPSAPLGTNLKMENLIENAARNNENNLANFFHKYNRSEDAGVDHNGVDRGILDTNLMNHNILKPSEGGLLERGMSDRPTRDVHLHTYDTRQRFTDIRDPHALSSGFTSNSGQPAPIRDSLLSAHDKYYMQHINNAQKTAQHAPQHRQSGQHNAQSAQHNDKSDAPGSVRDWQDGLRALLPDINISFSGNQQQQQHQQIQGNRATIHASVRPNNVDQPRDMHNYAPHFNAGTQYMNQYNREQVNERGSPTQWLPMHVEAMRRTHHQQQQQPLLPPNQHYNLNNAPNPAPSMQERPVPRSRNPPPGFAA